MSVVSVELLADCDGEVDSSWARKYSATWKVITNDRLDRAAVALGASGLPLLYSSYSVGNDSDPTAKCISRKAKFVAPHAATNGGIWHVTADYSTSPPAGKTENPLDEPPRYSLNWAQHERVVEKDINGVPVMNAVAEFFTDPPITEDDSRPVLVVTKTSRTILKNSFRWQSITKIRSIRIRFSAAIPAQ